MQLSRTQIIALVVVILAIILGYWITSIGQKTKVTLIASSLQPSSLAYNNADQSIYFFDRTNNQLSKVDQSGNITDLSEAFPNVDSVLWSPDFMRALIRSINDASTRESDPLFRESADDGLILTWLYDITDEKLTFVNADYGSVVWAGNDHIIYYFAGDNPGDVSQANPDGTNRQIITRLEGVLVSHIDAYLPGRGLLFTGGVNEEEDKLFFWDLSTREVQPLADKAVAWSNGNWILFSALANPNDLKKFDPETKAISEIIKFGSRIHRVAVGVNHALVVTEGGLLSLDLSNNKVTKMKFSLKNFPQLYIFPGEKQTYYFTTSGNIYRVNLR